MGWQLPGYETLIMASATLWHCGCGEEFAVRDEHTQAEPCVCRCGRRYYRDIYRVVEITVNDEQQEAPRE